MQAPSLLFKSTLILSVALFSASSIATPQARTQVKQVKKDESIPAISRDEVEIVFVLDTTGSMGGLIAGAKKKIWFIANEVLRASQKPTLKVGLVAFRDQGDAYVTKSLALTSDLDEVYTTLMAYRVGGGGDTPEDVNAGLNAAVNKQPWSQGNDVLKMVFLVGDAPPHMDYDAIKHQQISKDALSRNIYVHTIQCGNNANTQIAWKTIARNSEGRFAAIAQTGGVVATATPFDEELGKLAVALDATAMEIGSSRVARKRARVAAGSYAAAAPVSTRAERAMVKAKVVASADDDLVSLYEKKGAKAIAAFDAKDLPTELAKKPTAKRIKDVKRMAAKRTKLKKKIRALEKERADYIATAKKDVPATGFDAEVADMISTSMH